MKIDIHTHIFPLDILENREAYYNNEPAFQLLYGQPNAKIIDGDQLVKKMDEAGIDISVVFGFPWDNPSTVKFHNDYILHAVTKYPNRLIGFTCVNPNSHGHLQEAARCLKAGLKGVGEIATYQFGPDFNLAKSITGLMDLCLEKNVPLLLHTNEPIGHQYPGKAPMTLLQIYEIIMAFPNNKLILAHWGGGIFFYHLLKKGVKPHFTNVWMDTAASPFLYDADIYKMAIQILGPDKILFGSDYPLIPPGRYFKEMKNSGLSINDMKKICGDNAQNLFDF